MTLGDKSLGDKSSLLELADRLHRVALDAALLASERETAEAMIAAFSEHVNADGEEADFLRALLPAMKVGERIFLLVHLIRWAAGGFPLVQMPHTYVAALCATRVPRDVVSELRAPFPTFFIEVPSGLLSLTDPTSHQTGDIERIIVSQWHGEQWSYVNVTQFTMMHRRHVPTAELLSLVEQARMAYGHERAEIDFTEASRVSHLAAQLMVNVCLAMTDPGSAKPVGRGHAAHGRRRPPGTPPMVRAFQLGRPVTHDFRPALQTYVTTGRTGVRGEQTVQTLVAGHWRNQPHGPGSSLRRLQWIEPFWRGPLDAPIAIRPHRLRDTET